MVDAPVFRKFLASMAVLAMFAACGSSSAQSKPAVKKSSAASKRPAANAGTPEDMTPYKGLGSRSAPITMEVFGDYQCPACRDLYFQTLRQVIENYVASGKVYLVHRDFPLAAHQHSRQAARYAAAAARLGKLEPVIAALFSKQDTWSNDGNVDGAAAAALSPTELAKVRKLVKGGTLDASIDKDVSLGHQFRVTQTPTTIISYKGQTYPVVGVVSYSILKTFLEQLLRQ